MSHQYLKNCMLLIHMHSRSKMYTALFYGLEWVVILCMKILGKVNTLILILNYFNHFLLPLVLLYGVVL